MLVNEIEILHICWKMYMYVLYGFYSNENSCSNSQI